MSTAGVEVRTARPDEYAAVAELTASTYLKEGYGSAEYEPELRDVGRRATQAQVLVARVGDRLAGDRVVGAVTVATLGGHYAEQAEPGEAVIRMLVVDPSARGSGIGRTLVEACLVAARRDHCSRVRLSTQPDMTTAHRLYERLGFVRTPELDWSPLPDVPLLTYALDLS